MTRHALIPIFALLAVLGQAATARAQAPRPETRDQLPRDPVVPTVVRPQAPADPAEKYAGAFAAYDAADRRKPTPAGGVVFVGSSSIVDWNIETSFPDVSAITRGLWGSALQDTVHHVDRLVLPYRPRLVVLYAGDNDIDSGHTPERVAADFEHFVRAIHAALPDTRIAVIGIKPSPLRWAYIDNIRLANALIREQCALDDRLAFIDVDAAMLGWDDHPRPELYKQDGLHLSAAGYQLWSTLLRPFLR